MDKPKSKLIEPAIEWQAPEFIYREKDISWYWLSLIVSIILLALSVWQRNFLFAIFIVLGWLVVVYSTGRKPTIWNFKFNEKGFEISLPDKKDQASSKFYLMKEIEGFDIHELEADKKFKELFLKIKKRFSPYLKINFPAGEEEKIKSFLEKYIIREEYNESLADSVSKLIGF